MKEWLICSMLLLIWTLGGFPRVQAQSCQETQAKQQGYWVYFQDKDKAGFNPYTYFEPQAIERRLRLGLEPFDSLDLPVNENNISCLRELADSIDVVSRWLNAVYVYANPEQSLAIAQLPCVKNIAPAGRSLSIAGEARLDTAFSSLPGKDLHHILLHTAHMQGKAFQERGIDGRGVRIAIFDAGFPAVNSHNVFRKIRAEDRIIATWDFFRNEADVYHGKHHGTIVLSLIGGELDSISIGLAPGADFLLARTESWLENQVEEKNWLAAAEWADKWGADIINSSLGYTYHRYFPEEMDGQTSLISRAAAIAFQKGILIVNAAGNSGNSAHWTVMASPADAPSVMAVGALEYPSLTHASYSARGPTADGRIKPDLSALGTVYALGKSGFSPKSGTSFACPLVAGFAACVMQLHPDWTNAQVFSAMLRSGSLYPNADNLQGYGIPQAPFFFEEKQEEFLPPFDFFPPAKQLHETEVTIKENPLSDSLLPRFGMNRKHFGHFFASFCTPAGNPEHKDDKLNYAASNLLGPGYRYKFRISPIVSLASEWNLKRLAYFPQEWDKIIDPGMQNWEKRKLVILQTGTGLYVRINFDKKRGNYIGRYLDLGGYLGWNFNARTVYFSQGPEKEKIRTRFSNQGYVNPLESGLELRLGFQNIALITRYRLTEYFKKSAAVGDLPGFIIGIELAALPF